MADIMEPAEALPSKDKTIRLAMTTTRVGQCPETGPQRLCETVLHGDQRIERIRCVNRRNEPISERPGVI